MNSSDLKLEELEEVTEFLSRKWRPLILHTLSKKGEMGFNDLKEALGSISGKVLSENLNDLEEEGYLEKEVINENPKRVRYSLTSRGEKINPILDKMVDWADREEETFQVLVVEDEKQLAQLYSEWISGEFDVRTANSGSEAIEQVSGDIDVVLLDRGLPDSSGSEIADRISEHFDCKIVFLTARDPELDVADMDIDDYLVKPVSAEEVASKVTEMIDRSKKQDLKQELMALISKKQVLEEDHSTDKLEDEEKYQRLLKRIDEIRDEVS
jgi:DNA-binding HxlR family transcriptional regulator